MHSGGACSTSASDPRCLSMIPTTYVPLSCTIPHLECFRQLPSIRNFAMQSKVGVLCNSNDLKYFIVSNNIPQGFLILVVICFLIIKDDEEREKVIRNLELQNLGEDKELIHLGHQERSRAMSFKVSNYWF